MKTRLKSVLALAFAVALGTMAFGAPRVTETTTSSTIVKDIAMSQFDEAYDTGIAVNADNWEVIELDANKNVATADVSRATYAIKPGTLDGDAQIILKWLGAESVDTNRVFNINVATIRSMEKKVKDFDDAGKTATVEIVTHYAKKRSPSTTKVLFLGTACTSHTDNMKEALTNAVNGIASKSAVDYHFYYDNPDGTWHKVTDTVNQGSRMSDDQVKALTITGDDRVLANGHHAAMEEFYKLLSTYIDDLNAGKVEPYDYIVFEFDGSLLATASKSNKDGSTYGSGHSTYVYDKVRETKVATVLQRYYDLGRVCWIVNDWKNDEDQQADPSVDYFVPAKYSKGLLGDNNWKGLQGLLNPDFYLAGSNGVRQVKVDDIMISDGEGGTKKKPDATKDCWVGHGITRGIANEYEGSEEPAHWTTYTNATEIGEVLAKMLHVVDVDAVVKDYINMNLKVKEHRFYQSDDGETWSEGSLLGGSTLEKGYDKAQNCVTGVIHGLSADWWTKLEIDVKDENGKFLVPDEEMYWVTRDGDTYSYDPNDKSTHDDKGPALACEFDAETGKELTDTNAWTSVPWTVKVSPLTIEVVPVDRPYNGLATNLDVRVTTKGVDLEKVALHYSYDQGVTWEGVRKPDGLGYVHVTNETPIWVYADMSKDASTYYSASETNKTGSVKITPLTVTVTAGNATRAYDGTVDADLTKLTYSFDGSYAEGEQEQIEGLISAGITNEQGEVVAFTRKSREDDDKNVGEYPDDITTNKTLTANGNYTVLFKEGDFAITQKVVTVTADDKSLQYGSEVPEASFYTYTYDGFVSGETEETAVKTKPTFTSDYTKTTPVSESPLDITNNGAAEAKNYSFVYVDGELTITALPTLVVTPHWAEKEYDGEGTNVTFTVTDSEGGAITKHYTIKFRDNTEGNWKELNPTYYVSVTNTWIHYAVECEGYAPVTNTSDSVRARVNITPRTVEVNPKSYTKAYGEADPAKFEYTYDLSNVLLSDMDTVTNLLDTSNGSFDRVAGENVGSYPITDKKPFDAGVNYKVEYGTGTLTITQRWVTVTAQDYTRKPGDPNPADEKIKAECTVSPALLSGDAIVYTATCTYEGDEVGTHADVIVPSGEASQGNYHVTYVPGDLTITDREPLKIFIDDRTVTYGDKAPTNLAFKTGDERYDRPLIDVDETRIDGLDTVKFATAYRQGDPVGGNYPIYTNSADLSSVYYYLTVVPGHVTVLPAPITPVKPGEEPPADPTVPYTYAPDIVRYYDGAGTNINPVTVNLLPGNVPEYLFRLDGTDKFVPWKDLQITNVHYNADGSIKSNKVWYSVTTKPANYYSATNYAWVTILPNVVTVVAVDTNKVYGLDETRTPPTKPDPDFTWVVDWEKSAVAPGEEAAVLASLQACEKAAPEGKILMRIPEPVTPEGKKPETDMEDVLDDRAPHYKRFDVITTNSLFEVVIDGRRNYRVEFIPGDFAIYPDDVVFASESGTFDYVGIYDGKPHTIDLYVIPGADHNGNPTEVSFATLAEGPWSEWCAYSDDWRKTMPTYTHVTNLAPVYVKARNVPNFYETNMVAYVTITQRTVYVTAESTTRDYDGTELRNGDFTVAPATADTGFVGDEGFGAVTMTDDSAITAVGSVDNVIATTAFRDGTNPDNYRVVREKGLLTVTPAQILDDPTESAKPWAWASDVIVWTNDVPEVTVVGTNIVVRTGLWTAEDDAKAVLRYTMVDPAVAQPSDWSDSLTFREICNTQVWCNVSCENYSPTNVSAYVVILSKAVDVIDEGAEEEDKPLPNPKTEEAVNAVLDGIVDNSEILVTGDPNPKYDPTKPGWEAGQLDGHVYLAFTSIANLPQEEREAAELHLQEEAAAYKAANPNVRNFEARSVDVKLAYSQTFKDSSKDKIELIGDTNDELIPFTLAVDLSSNRQVLQVLRYHNGEKLPLTAPEGYVAKRNADDPANSTVTITAKRYSEFIILTGEPYTPTPTPPGGCEPVEVTEDGLVYQFRAQIYTTKGAVQAARSSGSVCAPDESSTCLVLRGRDRTVIDGWLYACVRTCSGLQDASVVMWDSRRKAKVSGAAFETQVLNIIGSRSTDAEWAWTLTGTVAYDGVREQSIGLVGAGYGTFNGEKRLYNTFSGNVAGTATASYDLETKNSKAVSECICEPSQVLTCETYDTLAYDAVDTVMFGRWKMKYNASASKLYGKKGTLKLPSYVKLDD